jgi:putative ABC transport system permease protein
MNCSNVHCDNVEAIRRGALMGRFILEQLRSARGRTLALAAGILVAAVSFTLLTSAATTSQLQALGTVSGSFRGAYDLLVRPTGSFTDIERERDLVRQNHLSGIFGGITMRQYEDVKALTGVEVAAPIANLGYVPVSVGVPVPLRQLVAGGPTRQLYRIRWTWVANGLSRYPDVDTYVYYTANPIVTKETQDGAIAGFEVSHGGRQERVCWASVFVHAEMPKTPYDRKSAPELECLSAHYEYRGSSGVALTTLAQPPMLLAAIDPEQEAKLVGLDRAVVSGRYLRADDRAMLTPPDRASDQHAIRVQEIPVLLSTRSYVDQSFEASIERLDVPDGADLPAVIESAGVWRFLRGLPGHQVGRKSVSADEIHRQLLDTYSNPGPHPVLRWLDKFTQVSEVTYRERGGRLAAVPRPDSEQVGTPAWQRTIDAGNGNQGQPGTDFLTQRSLLPPGIEDVRYRRLTDLNGDRSVAGDVSQMAGLDAVGQFDPSKLPGFSALGAVPLETYYPPEVEPADEPSRRALGGGPLRPTFNVGGYIGQTPFLLTTLAGMRPLLNPDAYDYAEDPPGGADGQPGSRWRSAPISVIRVRVAGVTGPDPVSRERIRRVAEEIQQRTGLAVDITAGSSPQPVEVELPAGRFGQPALLVREGWVRKGVAVVVLRALDRKSLTLFGLVLVVCALFLVNGGLAAVRARRRELGVLRCLGWSPRHVFAVTLGELVVVGALAGLAGVVLAAGLAALLRLDISLVQVGLVVPVAIVLAGLAGLPTAWKASRGTPLDAVHQRARGRDRARPVRGIATMAWRGLWRVPGRTLLGAAGLAIGVASLTVLLAINLAFSGVVAGTVLGDFLAAQVRSVDYAGVALALVLGAASVADILALNLRERSGELLTLSAAGWAERHLRRLVAYEGVAIGLLGSTLGAAAGLAAAGQLGQADLGDLAGAAAGAAVGGVAIVLALLPAMVRLLLKLPAPTVLAEE